MNGTEQNNGSYMPKSVNIINNATPNNPFKKSPSEREQLKKAKQKSKYYLMFRNKVVKPFEVIG